MQKQIELASDAVKSVSACEIAFAKFLSPNDTGLTGGHQCGVYIPHQCVPLIFDKPFERGQNHKRTAFITWNSNPQLVTESSFTYYGQKTRNEYRITRFGRGFELLKPDHTGDLIVICKQSEADYEAFVLSSDDSIQYFLDAFSISPTEVNCLIKTGGPKASVAPVIEEDEIFDCFYIERFNEDFPPTKIMAVSAEEADRIINGKTPSLSADSLLIRWIDTEYRMFRRIEERHYEYVTMRPAKSLDSFVKTGLEITNRRKARAGKSLEHHLASIFNDYGIAYTAQAVTEMNKKPDFIFPSEKAYHDASFPTELLTFLGSKTTCKDRWRQVLNEANRIENKYLFTLQQGASPNQLAEMHAEGLTLVVPEPYHRYYPKTDYENVISLEDFIALVLEKQRKVKQDGFLL